MKPSKQKNRERRHTRIRAKIKGTLEIPRVSVFRSNKNIFVQFIDDKSGKTLVSNIVKSSEGKGTKTEKAATIGETLAQKAIQAGISKVVFDRGGFNYHGRVRALAEGLRKGGLKF
ncbi:MAG: 50S ribosomal protein L18 [bacterium]|nr:50S ribosomal protein L18 [bacterium]